MIMYQIPVFPINGGNILCGDVHFLPFIPKDTESNEQFKFKEKSSENRQTNTKTFVMMLSLICLLHSMYWCDIYGAVAERHSIFIVNNVKWNVIIDRNWISFKSSCSIDNSLLIFFMDYADESRWFFFSSLWFFWMGPLNVFSS